MVMHGCPYRTPARIAAILLYAATLVQAEDKVPDTFSGDWLGAPSCSARACHGSTGVVRSQPIVWGNEHTIWREHDRHRDAFAVLVAPQGQQIAQRLGLGPAHEARQCLVCHAPAALSEPASPCTASYVTEGVGCESCHGPARPWIAAHTAADWQLLSPLEKERDFGFRNTKDLATRAQVCNGCHIGSAEADVNHDLIAAGHPRLTFEFASHLRRLPLHWDEKGENDRLLRPAFVARAWTIGQVAAAKAQLELLVARSEASLADRPGAVWPEFAEYSCYACHRSLKGDVAADAGELGKPAWGTWHFPLLPLVSSQPQGIDPHLTALRKVMSSLNAGEVEAAGEARAALRSLDEWLATASSLDPTESDLRHQLAVLAEQGPGLIGGEWDIAAQLYLALAAWQQARLDVQQRVSAEDQAIKRLLGESHRDLHASPADFARSPDPKTASPADRFAGRLLEARRAGLLRPEIKRP
jgi:hypothetical protein